MLTKLVTASLVVAVLTVAAPAATASHVAHDCRLTAASVEGSTFTGLVYGYVDSPTPGETVGIYCYVRINGAVVAVTDPATGPQHADVRDTVIFDATPEDHVQICHAWWASGGESGDQCRETRWTQVPPQEVWQLLMDLFAVADPLDCPVLAALSPGVPGVVDVAPDGDVVVLGDPFYECPPYDTDPQQESSTVRVIT